ncbi:MAG: DUF2062 domain-containing protein [Limisphaerales bacterium]
MNLRRWLHEHSLKLLAIRDTPEAIAGGVAIGIFFGFTPLFGLKTVSAILVAWLTRSNILAAVIAGALHDIILPFMPFVYRWEYDIGYYILANPHHWPQSLAKIHRQGLAWRSWVSFIGGVGKPLLVGGVVCATPFAILSFFVTQRIVARHQLKKKALPPPIDEELNPS